jgi:RHS repeat-associated protein
LKSVGVPLAIIERGGDIDLPGEIYLDREYVYGPDYVDEFIAQFDRDGHAIFMLQDGNYNVVVLVSGPGHPDGGGGGGGSGGGGSGTLPTGTVLEQYTYEPYGALVAAELYYAHAMNRAGHQGLFFERFDGSYDDYTLFRVIQGTAFITGAKGLYYNRNRFYSPSLGRFTTRDPNETALPILTAIAMNAATMDGVISSFSAAALFSNGLNLYCYLRSNPMRNVDPLGLMEWYDFDDAMAESFAYMGAAAESLLNKIGRTLDWMQYISGALTSFIPGVDVAVAGYEFITGQGSFSGVIVAGALEFGGPLADVAKFGGKLLSKANKARSAGSRTPKAALKAGMEYLDHVGKMGKYSEMTKHTAGHGGKIQAHHILEVRFLENWGGRAADGPAVILTKAQHDQITQALRNRLPYGMPKDASVKPQVWHAYKDVYKDYPELLNAIEHLFR